MQPETGSSSHFRRADMNATGAHSSRGRRAQAQVLDIVPLNTCVFALRASRTRGLTLLFLALFGWMLIRRPAPIERRFNGSVGRASDFGLRASGCESRTHKRPSERDRRSQINKQLGLPTPDSTNGLASGANRLTSQRSQQKTNYHKLDSLGGINIELTLALICTAMKLAAAFALPSP